MEIHLNQIWGCTTLVHLVAVDSDQSLPDHLPLHSLRSMASLPHVVIRAFNVRAQSCAGFFPLTYFFESASRGVHTSRVIPSKIHTQATLLQTGHSSGILCNVAHRMTI